MRVVTKTQFNYLTVLIGVTQIYAWATTYYIPAFLVKLVAEELGQSQFTIVGSFSWALLVGGLGAPRIGAWIEKKGGRLPLTLGSLLMGCGLLVLSQTHNLLVWYLGWTVTGIGMALGLFNAVFAAVGRLLGHDAKKMIIRITLISGFATLLWPLTEHLIKNMGWRMMLTLYAMPYFFVWAPLYFFSIPKDIPTHCAAVGGSVPITMQKINWIFYLLVSYAILRAIVGTTVSVNVITMFTGLGITLASAALVASLIGPAQIAGRLLEMFFGRQFDPIHSSIFWAAVLPFAIFILLFSGKIAAPIFAIAYGMSNGVLTITMGILPMILFGTKGYAELLGKIALPVLMAQAATPLLFAPLIENWPAIHVFILAAVLAIAALLCLLPLSYIKNYKQSLSN